MDYTSTILKLVGHLDGRTYTNKKLMMRGAEPIRAVLGQDVLRYHRAVIDHATLALFLKEEPA